MELPERENVMELFVVLDFKKTIAAQRFSQK
jgi:hypothetical protein